MDKIYRVKGIYEDDFGCEERCDDDVKVLVYLVAEDGEELRRRESDAQMYQNDINKGDLVKILDGHLEKL